MTNQSTETPKEHTCCREKGEGEQGTHQCKKQTQTTTSINQDSDERCHRHNTEETESENGHHCCRNRQ